MGSLGDSSEVRVEVVQRLLEVTAPAVSDEDVPCGKPACSRARAFLLAQGPELLLRTRVAMATDPL